MKSKAELQETVGTLDESRRRLVELMAPRPTEEHEGPFVIRPRSTDNAPVPLSFAQERLWLLEQLQPLGAAYNIVMALRLRGPLQEPALQHSFDALVARHDILRAHVEMRAGQPVQVIDPPQPVLLEVECLSGVESGARDSRLQQVLGEKARARFDLTRGPLLRVSLLTLAEQEHVLLVTMHHIISDGWSMGLLLRELSVLYDAYVAGRDAPLPPLEVQYADYALWQREWLRDAVLQTQLAYWKAQLADAPTTLELPTDRPRPTRPSFNAAVRLFRLSEALSGRIVELARKEGVTLYMLLLAVLQLVLSRWSGQSDVLIGSPIAGRTRRQTEGLIGFFVNTLVMRGNLRGNPTFRELLARTRETALQAHAHQDLPFDKLVAELQPQRDLSRQALFQVWFLMQHASSSTPAFLDLESQPVDVPQAAAKFDLTMSAFHNRNTLAGFVEYATDLFDASTIDRLIDHYTHLLEQVVEHPEAKISQLRLLTEEEGRGLLVEWPLGQQTPETDRCVHELFAEQVARTPEAPAVTCYGQQLTYAELERRSNQLAHYLRGRGVGPETIVGVCFERSTDMVVALLGILKAGGAYLPLDPTYPAQRLAFMVADAVVSTVLTHRAARGALSASRTGAVVLDVDAIQDDLAGQPMTAPPNAAHPDNLAYVIYTSGSTGEPKGTMLQHRGLTNLAAAQVQAFDGRPGDRVLQFASLSFDASVSEIFVAFLAGATVCLTRPGQLAADNLAQNLLDLQITMMTLPSSVLPLLTGRQFPRLRTLVSAGEACPLSLIREWAPRVRFINAYGPTEITVCATYAECSPSDEWVSIGRPLANTQVYVLDQELEPVPVGVVGELYIAGIGVARGYLGRSGLTAERFVSNPFGSPGSRMYRTGDRVRYRVNGALEFQGRMDHQIKVNGYRIEPGEIEAALLRHPALRQAIVIARDDERSKRLVAYVVPATQEAAPDSSALRRFLKESLPDHLIPSLFVTLDTLPLTPNGKVDRQQLLNVEPPLSESGQYVAPRTPAEKVLAQVWAEVLKLDRVGIHDNFFELGGMSFTALGVVNRAAEAGLSVPAADLFEKQTIAELAEGLSVGAAQTAQVSHNDGDVPLTAIQHMFVSRWSEYLNQTTVEIALEAVQPLQARWLREAVTFVASHHEVLGTAFIHEQTLIQRIIPASQLDYSKCFREIDLPDLDDADMPRAVQDIMALTKRIRADEPPLLRAVLIHRGLDQRQQFLLVVNHLVCDPWSMRVVVEDIQTVYEQLAAGDAPRLSGRTTPFTTWAAWLNTYAHSDQFETDVASWRAPLWSDCGSIPIDYPDADYALGSDDNLSVTLENAETESLLGHFLRRQHAQSNEVYLAALGATLLQWTASPAIAIDLISAGRSRSHAGFDLTRTVGWFSSLAPVRIEQADTPGVSALLRQVKDCLRTLPHEGLPYGVGKWMRDKGPLLVPQPQVCLNNLGGQQFAPGGLFRPSPYESFDWNKPRDFRRDHMIDLVVGMKPDGLRMRWVYSRNLHRGDTIVALAEEFTANLRRLAAGASESVNDALR